MERVSFEGQVVVVTGGGRGLGRAYCVGLAQRGASVVVSDVSRGDADEVVAAIEAAGGKAVGAYDSVATPEGGRAIVEVALERFGTLDGVVNNAGNMRPGYFEELTPERWQALLDVHVMGSIYVTQAAWPVFREKGYGRVVIISSSAGMFASHGRANYCLAKSGLYGLMRALAYEGREHGILVNALMPFANTTFTRDNPVPDAERLNPPGVADFLRPLRVPEAVVPAVGYLLNRDCTLSGETIVAGHGRVARVFVGETRGWIAPDINEISIEDVAEHLDEIRDLDGFAIPTDSVDENGIIAEWLGFLAAAQTD